MYKLKQIPKDFIVREISNVKTKESGRYSYYKLKKTSRNTLDVVKRLAKQLNVKEKEIGFAGSKDKHAVTEQVISVLGVKKDKVLNVDVDNVELEFFGCGNEPISLGDLEGNQFEIIIRNLDEVNIEKIDFVENYFDEQRFSKLNAEIGRYIVKKEFGRAVQFIGNEKCNEHLDEKKNDYIGALKKIPIRLLRMYVNAYQSFLWNETVAKYLKDHNADVKEVKYSLGKFVFVKNKQDLQIPLIGFDSEHLESEEIKPIIEKLMFIEELAYRDFIIKQIPQLSLEGEMRNVFINVKSMKIGKEESDELNPGKKKVKVKFSLGKGSYATMVIRKIIPSKSY